MIVEGGFPPDFPSTIKSTFGRALATSSEVLVSVSPRRLAEVRRSGPVSSRSLLKRGCFGRRRPIVLKLSKYGCLNSGFLLSIRVISPGTYLTSSSLALLPIRAYFSKASFDSGTRVKILPDFISRRLR